jgi:hypothetical protein
VEVRHDIWRFITQAARTDDEVVLEAAALLQMQPAEIRTLAQLHFVLSAEVKTLLDNMSGLVRRLTTTTMHETETSAERVRGLIVWGETFRARAVSGMRHTYVTAPTQRAYNTPENRLLVFDLAKIAELGRRTGWHRSSSADVGSQVRDRVSEATRWRAARSLRDVMVKAPPPADVLRVRSGRRRHYQSALDVYAMYQRYISRLDRDAVRDAVENQALVASRDSVLLELMCSFGVIRALRRRGWQAPATGLLRTPLLFTGTKEDSTVQLYYQHAPSALTVESLYRKAQHDHSFAGIGGLIPDMVLRYGSPKGVRWILVEVKGVERRVEESARAAARDLFAYRRALSPVLGCQSGPYGIGIAWGAELEPVETDEFVLCTPDRIEQALEIAESPAV